MEKNQENEEPIKRMVFHHENCVPKTGDHISISSADFTMCEVCGQYDNSVNSYTLARVILIEHEPCDCGDRINHNNGGNYHYSYYKVVEVFNTRNKSVLLDSKHTTISEIEVEELNELLNDKFEEMRNRITINDAMREVFDELVGMGKRFCLWKERGDDILLEGGSGLVIAKFGEQARFTADMKEIEGFSD